jgi:two-component system response regulator YesN
MDCGAGFSSLPGLPEKAGFPVLFMINHSPAIEGFRVTMTPMQNNLYSFVLVDDEPEIREGIRDTIPWEELGFRFAGACANGPEALELAERSPPDVLMTDINMPFMDGLALSERLGLVAPATKIIIISGFDDFEYARRALKLQVHDYIVKPITPGEFKEALRKIKQVLDDERAARQDLERIRKQLDDSLPLMRERFLTALVQGRIQAEAVAERLEYFGLPIPTTNGAWQCLALDFVRRKSGEDFDIDLLSERNFLEKDLQDRLRCVIFQDGEDRLVVLGWGNQTASLYREGLKAAEAMRRNLLNAGLEGMVIGVGEAVADFMNLHQSYTDAISALQLSLLKGTTGVSAYRELGTTIGNDRFRRPAWGKAMASALRVCNLDECRSHITAMTHYYKTMAFDMDEYHASLRLALAAILQSLEDLEIPGKDIFAPDSDPFAQLRQLKSLDEVEAWFTELAGRIVSFAGLRQENFAGAKVREALEYLETNYADPDLSMQVLCKELYISTSYLSANLKRYHDKTFVEHLTDIRISKAKELLRTTGLKTYEIAEKVGYRDAHYFSLSFRKVANCTPTEYRNRHEPGQT